MMSMHKIPLTQIEESGLRAHGLDIGTPSQLSDAFRQGVSWGQESLRAEVASLKEERDEAVRKMEASWAQVTESGIGYFQQENERLTQQLAAAKEELTKWRNWKPDDETMQELKEQSKDSSLAAKTAYIGALENRLAAANGRVERMREALIWARDRGENWGDGVRAALSDLPEADKEKS